MPAQKKTSPKPAKKAAPKPAQGQKKKAAQGPKKKATPALSQGLKTAFAIAANEVFYEWVSEAVEHPRRLLKSGDLGSSYQGFHGGLLDAQGAARVLDGGLAPWLTPPLVTRTLAASRGSAADLGCALVDAVTLAAGVEIAEAILLVALGREAELGAHLAPLLPHIRPLADRLASKIEEQDTDEDEEIAQQFA